MSTPQSPETSKQERLICIYEHSDWYWMDVIPPLTIDEVKALPKMIGDKEVERAPYVVMLSVDEDSEEPKSIIAYSSEVINSDEKLETLINTLLHQLGSVAVRIS